MIRECTSEDLGGIAALLSRAFAKDPLLSYLTTRSKDRSSARDAYFRFCFQSTQIRVVARSGAAAALWVVPDAKVTLMDQLRLVPTIIGKVGVASVARCLRAMVAIDQAHPKEPHFYLMAVGVDPKQQGKGLGSEIIQHTLRECDRLRTPAYLDTSNPRNLPLYQRLGFRLLGEPRHVGKAPPFWSLLRPVPQTVAAV